MLNSLNFWLQVYIVFNVSARESETVDVLPSEERGLETLVPALGGGSHWGKHHPRPFRGGYKKVAFSCEHRLREHMYNTDVTTDI